jgi:peptidoglycan/xylan/chitin deacetylase (PgdA/CDA1 family)
VKSTFKHICHFLKVNEALLKLHRSDMLVLCYHGVLEQSRADSWSYENFVDADSFRMQLHWLKQHVTLTDLAGMQRWHEGGWRDPRPPALITFDDGYRNNVTVAAPILREEGVPAVFFLATGYVGTSRVLWNAEVRVRILHWPADKINLPSGEIFPVPAELLQRRRLADRANRACKRLREDHRIEYLAMLRAHTPDVQIMDDPEARRFMSWDEARKLCEMGFEVGSHTVEHPILSQVDEARMADELRESKSVVELEVQQPCRAIAYPSGSPPDLSEALFPQVRAVGYDWAFTTVQEWAKADGDPYRISRVGFPGQANMATFKFYASGLHNGLSRPA